MKDTDRKDEMDLSEFILELQQKLITRLCLGGEAINLVPYEREDGMIV